MATAAPRVVALIDMDCFYCAVERALDPSLVGVPMAVVQYNPYQNARGADGNVGGVVSLAAEPASARVVAKGGKVLMPSGANGSIIAVSYEARKRGVTRFFRGREALAQCPEMVLVQVPTAHGKSDMTVYRTFGARTLKIIRETCSAESGGGPVQVEKASVDEMYVDVTAAARQLLARTPAHRALFDEALAAGTHVAGAAEADPTRPPASARFEARSGGGGVGCGDGGSGGSGTGLGLDGSCGCAAAAGRDSRPGVAAKLRCYRRQRWQPLVRCAALPAHACTRPGAHLCPSAPAGTPLSSTKRCGSLRRPLSPGGYRRCCS